MLKQKIDGKLTLWGIYKQYKKEIKKRWGKDTEKQYDHNYRNVIAPKFNDKAYCDYTHIEIGKILKTIKNTGYTIKTKGKTKLYSNPTMATFRSNIKSIDKIAVEKGIISLSLFWGTALDVGGYCIWNDEEGLIEDEVVEKNIRIVNTQLRKSLTPPEDKKVFKQVMLDPKQSGEIMGIALMYGCGLRNAEACGVKFEDVLTIDAHKDCFRLRIDSSINIKRIETANLKTKNAYRYIPITSALAELIIKRKEYIKDELNISDEEVNKFPIACYRSEFGKYCNTNDLTNAGRIVLHRAGVNGRILAYIDMHAKELDMVLSEKEPTAYLLRRNFGTMLQLLDFTREEIEYLMGHSILSIEKTRNYFSNSDMLYNMKLKMDNRPYFSSSYSVEKAICAEPQKTINIKNAYKQIIRVQQSAHNNKIVVRFKARNQNDDINVRVNSDGQTPLDIEVYSAYDDNPPNDETLSVLKLLHKRYGTIEDPET